MIIGLLACVFMLTGAASSDPSGAIARLLDSFHEAAARADEEAYFACFAEDAVFLGTDATERWTLPDFRAYAHPHFAAGRGWTYVPEKRNVTLGRGGRLAWFDEVLRNEKYGLCRGTGVVVKTADGWRVAQYSLTFLVPNDRAASVVQAIGAAPADAR